MKNVIWPLIILSYSSLFVFGISDNVRGPLFPEILREFSVSNSLGSLMFALSSFSGFFASYFARHLLRKYDRRTIIQWASIGLTLTLLGLAFSKNFTIFLFFSISFGLHSGFIGQIPNILVHLGSSMERKQQLLAGLHAMYGVAGLIAPLIASGITALTGSWRYTFATVAVVPFALFCYSLHKSHFPHHLKPKLTAEDHRKNKRENFRPQVFLACMLSCTVAAEVMISSRLALYMRQVWNYDLSSSSLYVTYFFIFLCIGRLLFTKVKFNRSIVFQLSLCLIVTIFLILLGLNFHPFFLVLIGFSIAPFYPLAITFISAEFPMDLDNAISYLMACDSIMLTSMHLLIGKLTDHFGIRSAIFSSISFLCLSLLAINSYTPIFKILKRSNR